MPRRGQQLQSQQVQLMASLCVVLKMTLTFMVLKGCWGQKDHVWVTKPHIAALWPFLGKALLTFTVGMKKVYFQQIPFIF